MFRRLSSSTSRRRAHLLGGIATRSSPRRSGSCWSKPAAAGVQQAHKEDRITLVALAPWPGALVCAEGRYLEGEIEKRAAIFIGPEFGTVQRADLVAAAREPAMQRSTASSRAPSITRRTRPSSRGWGRIPVLKARMNADLHMAEDLKNTGKGNLFVIFGEPDITLLAEKGGRLRVKVNGVDVFKPQTGEVVSDSADGSPAGSSTRITTKRVISYGTLISLARTTPTARSRPR